MNIRMKRGMALALTASLLLAGSAQALFGLGKSKPETVSPENGPTARDLEIRTYRGIPYLGQLEAADPDGGELTFAIVTQPKKAPPPGPQTIPPIPHPPDPAPGSAPWRLR